MIAYITGASSGLGAYTAQALADNGWTVVAGARSFTAETDGRVTRLPLDVTRDDSVRDFMERAKQIGTPDAVIHCAAVLCFGSCEETALADYARVMETNFLGMVRVNQQVLPLMREKGGGKVVLFSSINGLMGLPFQSAYTASKHAIEGYAECLAQEVTPFGIQVMLIEPGDHRGGSSRCRLTSAAMTDAPPTGRISARERKPSAATRKTGLTRQNWGGASRSFSRARSCRSARKSAVRHRCSPPRCTKFCPDAP